MRYFQVDLFENVKAIIRKNYDYQVKFSTFKNDTERKHERLSVTYYNLAQQSVFI